MANSIIITSYVKIQLELTATAVAITPGELLELTSAGTVQAHSAAAGNVLPMVAFEDELQGRGIDTDYATSAKIQVLVPRRGDIMNMLLADGETAVIGSFLESNGAGALQVHVADEPSDQQYPENLVGQAIEALDLSDSANLSALGRIQVRII
jgi:hypothetical protein